MRLRSLSSLLFCALATFAITNLHAQGVEAEPYMASVQALYKSAKLSFKDSKTGAAMPQADGTHLYSTSLAVPGAKECFITMDSEKSLTYVAVFEFKTIQLAEQAIEEMITNALTATSEFGLTRSRGTEMRYVKFQKHTLEFPSDNIDIMGRYPSFSFGVIRESMTPGYIEMLVNEPLWK